MGDTTYDSVGEAALWGLIDGLICGALIGVAFAAFQVLIPIFAIAVALNIASAIYYYALSKDAFISHQWYEAFVYFYTAVCCVVTGVVIAGYAEACQNAWNDIPHDSVEGVDTNSPKMVRVGRWMSKSEYEKMKLTGEIQPSYDNPNVKHVSYPSDINAFKNAPDGSVYVEFDVPADSVKPAGSGWGRIPGPDSPESKLNEAHGKGKLEFPAASNIRKIGEK